MADNNITIRIVIVVFLSSSSLKANNLTIEEIFIFTNNIENKILKNNAMHFKITIFFFSNTFDAANLQTIFVFCNTKLIFFFLD